MLRFWLTFFYLRLFSRFFFFLELSCVHQMCYFMKFHHFLNFIASISYLQDIIMNNLDVVKLFFFLLIFFSSVCNELRETPPKIHQYTKIHTYSRTHTHIQMPIDANKRMTQIKWRERLAKKKWEEERKNIGLTKKKKSINRKYVCIWGKSWKDI